MRLLVDTHLLIWSGSEPERLSISARRALGDPGELLFSAASIWELAIKASLGRPAFNADAGALRQVLVEAGYVELPVTSAHGIAVQALPMFHRDPFDRLLVAQAVVEKITLLTSDQPLSRYGAAVHVV